MLVLHIQGIVQMLPHSLVKEDRRRGRKGDGVGSYHHWGKTGGTPTMVIYIYIEAHKANARTEGLNGCLTNMQHICQLCLVDNVRVCCDRFI